jgi:hypothetical protein
VGADFQKVESNALTIRELIRASAASRRLSSASNTAVAFGIGRRVPSTSLTSDMILEVNVRGGAGTAFEAAFREPSGIIAQCRASFRTATDSLLLASPLSTL